MCGIIGYVGRREAAPILVEGLHRLEYRGYDSAGLAVQNGAGVMVTKLAGRVRALGELLGRAPLHGTSGIAHTRWATHGAPTTRNAHPHTDCSGTLALVHNGIIENADALRAVLEHTRSVVYLDDGDIAVLTPAGYSVLDRESHVQLRAVDDVSWDVTQIELGGYAHFMLKEIMEQPETVRATLRGRLLPEAGSARLDGLNLTPEECRAIQRIVIVACGTSWHAGLVGRDVIE